MSMTIKQTEMESIENDDIVFISKFRYKRKCSSAIVLIIMTSIVYLVILLSLILGITQIIVAEQIKETKYKSNNDTNLQDWKNCLSINILKVDEVSWMCSHGIANFIIFGICIGTIIFAKKYDIDAANIFAQYGTYTLFFTTTIWWIWSVVIANKMNIMCILNSRKLYYIHIFCLCDHVLWIILLCMVAIYNVKK